MSQNPVPPKNHKPTRGRPSVFTPKVRAAILEARRLLVPLKHCTQAAGISYDTLNDWMNRGRQEERGEYRHFFQQLQQVESQGVIENVRRISEAGKRDWKAAAHLLERLFPQEFGRWEPSPAEIEAIADEAAREMAKLVPDPQERLKVFSELRHRNPPEEMRGALRA